MEPVLPPGAPPRMEAGRSPTPTGEGQLKPRRPVKARPEGVAKTTSPSSNQLAEKLAKKRAAELERLSAPQSDEGCQPPGAEQVLVDDDTDADLEEPPGLTAME